MLPLHPNPAVQRIVAGALHGLANVHLLRPVIYPGIVWRMLQSRFVITDSGGLQEEAPVLGKPVIVTREQTERVEAVEQGSAVVAGWDPDAIFEHAHRWLVDPDAWARRSTPEPLRRRTGGAALRRSASSRDGPADARCRAVFRRTAKRRLSAAGGAAGRGPRASTKR